MSICSRPLLTACAWDRLHRLKCKVSFRCRGNGEAVLLPGGVLGYDSCVTFKRLVDSFEGQPRGELVIYQPGELLKRHTFHLLSERKVVVVRPLVPIGGRALRLAFVFPGFLDTLIKV